MKGKNKLKLSLPLILAAGIGFFMGTTAQASDVENTSNVATSVPVATQVEVATDVPVSTMVPVASYVPVASATEQMQENVSGHWTESRQYCFEDGTYALDCQVQIDGKLYFFNELGLQKTGWQTDGTDYYYYDPNTYEISVGDVMIGENTYIFGYDGKLKSGWRNIEGERTYFNADGSNTEGWLEYDGKYYYLNQYGTKKRGETVIDGFTYKFDFIYGNEYIGFVDFSDGTISYFNTDGSIATDWYYVGSKRYYAGTTGKCYIGWQDIDANRYHFDESGAADIGWITDGGKKYYANDNGSIQRGWGTVSGKTYYFDPTSGQMSIGFKIIDSHVYYFNKSGIKQTGWQTIDGGKYYLGTDGIRRTGFQTIGSSKYYFNASGVMQTGWKTIDGSKYHFDSNGVMATGKCVVDGVRQKFGSDGKYIGRWIVICIDAGHYGYYNQSPVYAAYYESIMNWKLHLYYKEALESMGIDVILTRDNEATDKGLEARGKTSAGCDLFLSVHSNAVGNAGSAQDGPLACCTVTGEVDDLGLAMAQRCAQVMGTTYGGSIWKRVGNGGYNYYGVIRGAASVGTPGILLEHSYHTNLRSTLWLMNNNNLRTLAYAEARVIANYFGV